ncbi:hypothetical protein SANTM175S_00618 [Streptomyces antimycoticus]
MRALHFPRASLPISFALQQLQQLLFSMIVLVIVLLGFGHFPSFAWLLIVPRLRSSSSSAPGFGGGDRRPGSEQRTSGRRSGGPGERLPHGGHGLLARHPLPAQCLARGFLAAAVSVHCA